MSVSKIKPPLKSIVRTEFVKEKRNDKPGSWVQTCFQHCITSQNLQKNRTALVNFESKTQANQMYLQVTQSKMSCVVTEPRNSQNEPFGAGIWKVFGLYWKFLEKFSLFLIQF